MKCGGARGGLFEPFLPRLKETVSSNICWRIWAELPSIGAPLWNKGKAKCMRWPIFSLSSRCSFLLPNPSACSFFSDFFCFACLRWHRGGGWGAVEVGSCSPELQGSKKPRLIPAQVWRVSQMQMVAFRRLKVYEAAQDVTDFSASEFRAVGKLQRRLFDSSMLQQ